MVGIFSILSRAGLRPAGVAAVGLWLLPSAGWPQIQLSLAVQTNPVVTVSGPGGTAVQIQWTTNLTSTTAWFHLAHATLSSPVTVADTNAPAEAGRFYRGIILPNPNMVLVPAGTFARGDNFNEGFADERPTNSVFISAFFMDRFEVTRSLWDDVYLWAVSHGYNFSNFGEGKGASHPIHFLNWFDAVKWCNARSEKEGRGPVYFTSAAQTTVYRSGELLLTNSCVRWSAAGYRLPTEAEWEKASRAGANGHRFPWGATVSFSNANYRGSTFQIYDTTGTNAFNPAFESGNFPYTSPIGSFAPNAYGLSDLAGNVMEWCWDGYDAGWFTNASATAANTAGPAGVTGGRIVRGGSWASDASYLRCASRTYAIFADPTSTSWEVGFRTVMSLPVLPAQSIITNASRLADGSFRFTIANLTPGLATVVAASTNLNSWTPVWTNVPAGSSLEFTNAPTAGGFRMFRCWQVP
jgi:formylglycine-generating enzyme required for sulfatase activity